jgi:GTP-binding protein Era
MNTIHRSKQKSCLISIIGKPNAGKSTLLNKIIGQKISAVTHKPQTTRNVISGIVTFGDTQLVLLDTPGIFAPKRALDRTMVRSAWSALNGSDIVCILIDSSREMDEDMLKIIQRVRNQGIEMIGILNKSDLDPKVLEPDLINIGVKTVISISAKYGSLDDLIDLFISKSQAKPWLYAEDDITTAPMRFLASEITREKLFLALEQELPYFLDVTTEAWKTLENGSIKIDQNIILARNAHKKIVLGHHGATIKKVSMSARKEIEELLGITAHLYLFVKVREDWDER